MVTLLTQIGAVTGFIAFLFKAVEFCRDWRDRRPHLRIRYSFTSNPYRGNTILILNSSKVGTTIHSYSLEALPRSWMRRSGWWRRFSAGCKYVEFDLEDRHSKVEVPAYGQAAIPFAEADHFQWGVKRVDDLYLRIWTSTRDRPYSFLVAKAGGD